MAADPRSMIADSLQGWMTAEQLDSLLNEILAAKKGARGWCPNCRKAVQVEILDAGTVVKALAELANQGFGRPKEQQVAESERIVFQRVVASE